MARKTADGKKDQRERLERELCDLLPEIEAEGLLFLIKQANTIIHNQRAVRISREEQELQSGKRAESGGKKKADAGFTVSIEAAASGKNYRLIINGTKHFLDLEETRKVVELCYRPETKSAALRYLYQFFSSERSEILSDHRITSPESPFFGALFREVRQRFTL